ncbi:hypothetical protein HQ37_05495 [Porphyromonas sp. COT-239 OH1446]|nr:hypothetical protein HQ37_05495 [Porphyromonas sp. COT-239 OH1446]
MRRCPKHHPIGMLLIERICPRKENNFRTYGNIFSYVQKYFFVRTKISRRIYTIRKALEAKLLTKHPQPLKQG